MKNIDWNKIEDAYIEMQETGRQAIITLPKIEKEIDDKDGSYTLELCSGGDYFVYGLDLNGEKQIELLNIKEQLFGDFREEIRYNDRADTFTTAENNQGEEWIDTEHFEHIVAAILDKSSWVQCHYIEISSSDIDRMYLEREGEDVTLDNGKTKTGRTLQYNVNKQEFVYEEEDIESTYSYHYEVPEHEQLRTIRITDTGDIEFRNFF